MKYLAVVLFFTFPIHFHAQQIDRAAATEDLEFLIEKIKQYDPALPYYHPEFDSIAALVVQKVTVDSISVFNYFSKLSKICALANEGHFVIASQADYVRKGFMDNRFAYLPIQVEIVDGKVFISKDYSNEPHSQRGEEILAINGKASQSILKELIKCTPSDGHIVDYALGEIEVGFAWLYYLHIEQVDFFEIKLKNDDLGVRTIKIKALPRSEQVKNYKKFYPKKESQASENEERFHDFEINPDFAYLKLPSFDYRRIEEFKLKSKRFYKQIFKELQEKEVKHLIIDLRGNTGGRNEFADDMVPFIMKDNLEDPYLKETIKWDGKTKTYRLPKSSRLAFKGSIYTLVNEKTFSAGSSLARFLKEYGNAITIGSESGSRYEGFAAGSKEIVNMPNSKIMVAIPRYLIKYPDSKKQQSRNRGLLPDYEIKEQFKMKSNNEDLALKKAISLIQSE